MPSVLDRIAQVFSSPNSDAQQSPAGQKPGQPQQPGIQGQIQQNIQQNAQQPGGDPAKAAAPGVDPADEMHKIWEQRPGDSASAKQIFTPDMEKFKSAVAQMDFTQGIDPQLAQKALGGDTEALMTLINSSGRNAYAQSTLGSRELIEHALRERTAELERSMEQRFKALRAGERAAEQNAAFKDPLVQPLLRDIQGRLQTQFPEASAEELAERAQKMLVGMAQKIVSQTPDTLAREAREKQTAAQQPGAFNWEDWATQGSQSSAEQQ